MAKTIRKLALLLIACLSISLGIAVNAQAQAGKADAEAEVAKIVLSILKKTDPNTTYIYSPEKSEILVKETADDPSVEYLYLGNLTSYTVEMSDSKRRDYIEKFLATATKSEVLTIDAFKKQARLRARTLPELQLRRYYTGMEFPKALNKPVGDLYLETVLDTENAVKIVTVNDLESLKISEKTAFDIALKNLKATITKKPWTKLDEHIWASSIEDDYDVARLVAFIDQMKLPFKGRLTAYMPAHSIVLITDSEDPKTINDMIATGASWAENMRPVSETLWRYDGGKWHAWQPAKNHRSYEAVLLQYMVRDLRNYEEQKNRLDVFYQKAKNPAFVSPLQAEKNGDTFHTTTLMVINSPVSIPKSDIVYFAAIAEEKVKPLGHMAWGNFANILGSKYLKPVPDMVPVRYEFQEPLPQKIINDLLDSEYLKPAKQSN